MNLFKDNLGKLYFLRRREGEEMIKNKKYGRLACTVQGIHPCRGV